MTEPANLEQEIARLGRELSRGFEGIGAAVRAAAASEAVTVAVAALRRPIKPIKLPPLSVTPSATYRRTGSADREAPPAVQDQR